MARLKWSGNRLARESGVPQPTISRLLSGRRICPEVQTAKAILNALHLSPEEIKQQVEAWRKDEVDAFDAKQAKWNAVYGPLGD